MPEKIGEGFGKRRRGWGSGGGETEEQAVLAVLNQGTLHL